jgi:hypothetical protein
MREDLSPTRASYDELAATYTARLFEELAGKPLDRHLSSASPNRYATAGRSPMWAAGRATSLGIYTTAACECSGSIFRPR